MIVRTYTCNVIVTFTETEITFSQSTILALLEFGSRGIDVHLTIDRDILIFEDCPTMMKIKIFHSQIIRTTNLSHTAMCKK